ncbi:2-keto-4-pentenoate hydratase [Ornithinicoccus halotolerans]|uniref:2-keto-4-pentenoate hydratase n=1 Tax=Ornithinicoccus halotolerans TaxID=1748220 RepID=UPI001E5AF8F8|nr:fumarylacetoacetate hydrolase family protein [Ornithinicoccus halotolerans]
MLTETASRRAFEVLWGADQSGHTVPAIPEEVRPRTRADGYAVQAHFESVTDGLAGWKIAATSEAGQRHIGTSGPLAGRVLGERVIAPSEAISLAGNFMHLVELEFAFRLGADLTPRPTDYSQQEVLEATTELLLAWEVPSTRYDAVASVGEAQLIADNACGFHLTYSTAAEQAWKDADLASQVVRASSSSGRVHDGIGSRCLGDPKAALTWLVNEVSGLGITLQAGQLVTTGTCIDPMPVAPGDTVTGDWGRFGTLQVTFC